MKKLLLFLFIVSFSLLCRAQSEVKYTYYAEVVYTSFSSYKPIIKFGGETYTICDENMKPIKFDIRIDVLNYLSKRGWKLAKYLEDRNIYTYIVFKEVSDDSQAKDALVLKKNKY